MTSRPKQPWHESDDPSTLARAASWRLAVWIVAAVVFFTLLAAAGWWFNVATSDVKGRGDAVRTVNAAGNRLAQQAYFEQTFADIKAADRKLTALAADAATHPADQDARTRLVGAENYCQGLAGDYNAAARKQVAEQFRAVDLPSEIDTTDPLTDCEPPK